MAVAVCRRSSRLCGRPWRKRSMYLGPQRSMLVISSDSNSNIKEPLSSFCIFQPLHHNLQIAIFHWDPLLFKRITYGIGTTICEGMVWLYETKAYFASTESCWTPSSEETVDFPALVDCLGVSMSDEAVVLAREDPQSVEGQDSAKTGSPSVAAKQRSRFSNSRWLSGLRACNCGLVRWSERTGLKVCKRTKKVIGKQPWESDVSCRIFKIYFKTYCFFLFLWKGLVAGWVVMCLPDSGCWLEGVLPCEQRSTVEKKQHLWPTVTNVLGTIKIFGSYLDFITTSQVIHNSTQDRIYAWSLLRFFTINYSWIGMSGWLGHLGLTIPNLERQKTTVSTGFRVALACPQKKVTMESNARTTQIVHEVEN